MADFDPDAYIATQSPAPEGATAPAFDPDKYLAENTPTPEAPTHESIIKRFGKMATGVLPTAGMIGGELIGGAAGAYPGSVAGSAAGSVAGKKAEQYLNEKFFDEKKTAAEQNKELWGAANEGAIVGAIPFGPIGKAIKDSPVGEAVGSALSPVGEFIAKQAEKVPAMFKGAAEKKAVQATGATGKQAMEFEPEIGRILRDKGIVSAGNSQKAIADKAEKALVDSGSQIGDALKTLDKKGVSVDTKEIGDTIQARIDQLRKSAASPDHTLANKLEGELEILKTSAKNSGSTSMPASEAERVKRTYDQLARDWTDPDSGQLGKEMYGIWKKKVEDVAAKLDPETAKKFMDAKETYGALAPVMAAAKRRAAVIQQHAPGGFLDMVSSGPAAVAGYQAAGIPGAVAGAVGAPLLRRGIAPRIPATTAAAYDALAGTADKILQTIPKYAEMAAKSPESYQAALKLYIDHNADERAAKGPDKWAAEGYDNLLKHGADIEDIGKARTDEKAKDLLVQASEEKPGSKAMDKIEQRLKAKVGSK